MSFCIVEFEGPKKEVAVVHRSWLCGAKCYWPNFWRNNKQLSDAIQRGSQPDPTLWSLYSVHVVGNRFYDSYEAARSRLSKAQDGSELSDDAAFTNTSRKTRKRSAVAAGTEADSSSLSDEEAVSKRLKVTCKKTQPVTMPLPPTFPQSPMPNPENFPVPGNPTLVHVSYHSDEAALSHVTATNPVSNFDNFSSPVENQGRGPYVTTATNQEYRNPTFTNNYGQEMNEGTVNMITSLQHGQALNSAKLDMALDLLRTIVSSQHGSQERRSQMRIDLPLKTLEEFSSLENSVRRDEAVKESLIALLSIRGGTNPNQITHRVVAALMTDELMCSFTFSGQTGKETFRKTIFLQCICESVRLNRKASVASDLDIEKATEYWLKKASHRIKKRNERSERAARSGIERSTDPDDSN